MCNNTSAYKKIHKCHFTSVVQGGQLIYEDMKSISKKLIIL